MNLAIKIRQIPQQSGIYQYLDKNHKILYIGKAKNLKKRVKSYFSINGDEVAPAKNLSPRIANMITKIYDIKTIIVHNEQEALILENSLIKQLKPRYNILLRDDKTYPYIVIDKSANFPRLEVSRKIINDKNLAYYGPYASGLKEVLRSIYEMVPLVQKKSCLKSKKICLFYQIKRCKAPCEDKITREEYATLLEYALDLLKHPQKIITKLTQKMHSLADELRFEEANTIKIRIQKLATITQNNAIDFAKLYNCDIFAIHSSGQKSVAVKIFMRDGRVTFSDHYIIPHNENDVNVQYLYTQALISHYKHNPPLMLDSILLPVELDSRSEVEELLAHFGKKIPILTPKSGDKRRLVELAINNAKNIAQNSASNDMAYKLQSLLQLDNMPCVIEVFDTSHHGGSNSVGGMIVCENGEFNKSAYRRYHLEGSDEYSQMSELLMRRAKDFTQNPPPDLWLLDGGIGQINIANEIINSSGANVDIVAIAKEKLDSKAYRAKGGARDIIRTLELEIRLDKEDSRLQFLQKLRDEAHRYAITFHRLKKTKTLKDSRFTPSQTKKLLHYFGSFEAIQGADEALIQHILKQKHKQN